MLRKVYCTGYCWINSVSNFSYILAEINIADRATYAAYEAGFMTILLAHGGTLLAVDDEPITLEGQQPPHRRVILRFDSEQAARDWYLSDAYQALMQHRVQASEGVVTLLQGQPLT